MTTLERNIASFRHHGLAKIDQAIRMLKERRAEWEDGMYHTPRQEIEALAELSYLTGVLETLTRLLNQQERGNQ